MPRGGHSRTLFERVFFTIVQDLADLFIEIISRILPVETSCRWDSEIAPENPCLEGNFRNRGFRREAPTCLVFRDRFL